MTGAAEGLEFWLCGMLTTMALFRQGVGIIAAAIDEASHCVKAGTLRVEEELIASEQVGLSP